MDGSVIFGIFSFGYFGWRFGFIYCYYLYSSIGGFSMFFLFSLWLLLTDFWWVGPENLANRLVLTGLISRRELWYWLIVAADWVCPQCYRAVCIHEGIHYFPTFKNAVSFICNFHYSLSLSLSLSLSFFLSFSLSFSLSCIRHKILKMWNGFLGSLGIWFHWDSLPPCSLVPFDQPCSY